MAIKILIVGSGIVGEATGTVLAGHGFDVSFADVNKDVVNRLKAKGLRAFQPEEIQAPETDIYMVSVPTYPIDICRDSAEAEKLEKSMSPLEWCEIGIDFTKQASVLLGKWVGAAKNYQVVVIRSAVLPGTTEKIVIPTVEERSGKKAGKDFGVCVNPEYLREVSNFEDIAKPWITTIGELDKRSGDLLASVYSWTTVPLYRISIIDAEMQKFVHNLYNATKISFFNEMRLVCEQIGADCNKIFPIVVKSAEAQWNPAYGTKDYGPFGGKCLPKDTLAFMAWAKRGGIDTKVMEAVIEVNRVYERRLAAGKK